MIDTRQSNPITTAEECSADHARYDAQARPQLDRMLGMSGAMDDCRRAMSQGGRSVPALNDQHRSQFNQRVEFG